MAEQDAIDRLLEGMSALEAALREVREEGRARHEANRGANSEMRDSVRRMSAEVSVQAARVSSQGGQILEVLEQMGAHHRLIMALSEQQASNNSLLGRHAELITNLGEAIVGAKDRAREAQQSAHDLRKFTEEFQLAVTKHVSDATRSLHGDMGALARDGASTSAKVSDLTVSTGAIVAALNLETQVDQARKGLPPDTKDRTALDALRSKGQGSLIASVIACLLIVLRIAWEVLQQSHVAPPTPVAPTAFTPPGTAK